MPEVLTFEGGYQSIPQDRGNYSKTGELIGTNYGISARFAEGVTGQAWSKQDMIDLSRPQAQFMYKWFLYKPQRVDEINDRMVALVYFDGVVNHSKFWGTKILQRALNNMNARLIVDGIIGDKTLKCVNTCIEIDSGQALVDIMLYQRRQFYAAIVRNNSSQKVFLTGWLNRIDALEEQSKKHFNQLKIF